jgi:drug/metabolite transporter (DMT)-like permease
LKQNIALAYFMTIVTVLAWATGIVIGRGIFEVTPPIGLSFWRWFIPTLCLIPWAMPKLKTEGLTLISVWKPICAMGFFMVGSSALSMMSVNYTTAINVSLVNAGQPLTTAVIAWIIFKEKLTLIQTLGIILGAIGIIVMVSRAKLSILQMLQFNTGDLVMFVAIIGYGSYANTLRKIPKELSFTVALFAVFGSGCIGLLPFYIYESFTYMTMPLNWSTVIWVLILAIFTSLIPTYFWSIAVSIIGVNRSAIFVNLIPVFGAILAIIFLNEKLHLFHIIGALMIFFGILLVIKGHNSESSLDKASST